MKPIKKLDWKHEIPDWVVNKKINEIIDTVNFLIEESENKRRHEMRTNCKNFNNCLRTNIRNAMTNFGGSVVIEKRCDECNSYVPMQEGADTE